MAKKSTTFVCQNCEATYSKWQGQCLECGVWNQIEENLIEVPKSKKNITSQNIESKLLSLPEVGKLEATKNRLSTGIQEFDRVLGGDSDSSQAGMVAGAVMLIGGEPGIGKSTLLTQMVVWMMATHTQNPKFQENSKKTSSNKKTLASKSALKNSGSKNKRVESKPETASSKFSILYVCGEESPSQIGLRINRILENEHNIKFKTSGDPSGEVKNEQFLFCTSTDTDTVVATIEKIKPSVVIIDSIQTMTVEELSGAAGSAGQIRESADRITTVVKRLHIPTFLVGHVTKEGVIAGPKVLEHIVDSVLELSGDRTGSLRILRAVKNRFGATDEVGVFQMKDWGLDEVTNPSQLFLEHAQQSVPGSATICVMEGTRPLLVEVQALVVGSQLAMPRRVGRGVELSRIQVLAAVLQKHANLPFGTTDVFLSAVGGMNIKEPAADLGLAVALSSSLKNKPLPGKIAWIGEIGLLGEIRPVSFLEKRIKEAKRLGFDQVVSSNTHKHINEVIKQFLS